MARPTRPNQPSGRLRLELRDQDGTIVLTRRAENAVLQSGASLLAALFTGQATGSVNGIAVGVRRQPLTAPWTLGALTLVDAEGHAVLTRSAAPLGADATRVEVLALDRKVRVHVRGTIPGTHALPAQADARRVDISEAAIGVLSTDGSRLETLYNHVVFDPVPKAREHELAFYWEIDFPYGE